MENFYFFVANWKMKLGLEEELNFASFNYDQLVELSQEKKIEIILCPSFISLYTIAQIFKNTKIKLGAQNCSKHSKGAFTGQICAESLYQSGCNYCIIGHSESRKENKETDEDISQKFTQLINNKISPILCIGDNEQEYKQGKVFDILTNQLERAFNLIKTEIVIPNYFPICIAYEPIWSIGTGIVPKLDHLQTTFAWLNKQTQNISTTINWKLIYGGSVNRENIESLKTIQNLNGFLIGNASLDFQEFKKIVK